MRRWPTRARRRGARKPGCCAWPPPAHFGMVREGAQGPRNPRRWRRIFRRRTRALIPEAAAWRLARIVGGEYPRLLAEWLELASASGRVLPPHWLPLVLEHVPPASRHGAGAVLGPAASWLAARHPTWLVAAPVAEASDLRWQEGSTSERVAQLEAVRRISTVRARAWLRTTWDTDPPEAREAFLNALLPTLEPQDEEILEMALDDKRKAVRQAAAEALSRLPASAHAQRNLARLGTLIELSAPKGGLLGLGRSRKLVIELPTAPDKAAVRDGIEPKVPAGHKIGERAFWLMQMVTRVPPRYWCERFSCDASTFLAAALASDFKNELLEALTGAATRHPDGEWAGALADAWLEADRGFEFSVSSFRGLLAAQPSAVRRELIARLLRGLGGREFAFTAQLLNQLDSAWDSTVTELAFERLADVAISDRNTWSQPRNSLDDWARNCDIATGARRAALLLDKCGDGHTWRNALEQFNDIVAFRAAMHEELKT